jgi:iron only hydrogenase large subunit-like protein/predicted  nucleic acid-binding Zn-ribbon protein
MRTHYSPVIGIDDAKCKNCHACIEVCPVKFCLDGSGSTIKINEETCIGCGRCIDACSHEARFPLDDAPDFFRDLGEGAEIVAIIAPAAAANFGGKIGNLVGYLRSLGVKAVYDASFGAELTTESYRRHIVAAKPKTVIAQPCPAIVSFLELYHPELIQYLAPVDSPLLHSAKAIRRLHPECRSARIAAITPCLAKKREFEDTDLVSYNVTFRSIEAALGKGRKTLDSFQSEPFDGLDGERGRGYPLPGGLMRTVARDAPEVARRIRTIEGTENVYEYFDSLSASIAKGTAPLVLDCLNCAHGCVIGPGTDRGKYALDDLKTHIETRSAPQNEKRLKALRKTVEKAMTGVDFGRTYVDRSGAARLNAPTEKELGRIYLSMDKKGAEDIYNCASCGYGSCEDMAKAIFNGLNKAENCHHYQKSRLEDDQANAKHLSESLNEKIVESERRMASLGKTMESLSIRCAEQAATIEESSAAIENMLGTIGKASRISVGNRERLVGIASGAKRGEETLSGVSAEIGLVRDSMSGIGNVSSVISDIAEMINLLAMNAAIEAAHAGSAGKGFAVISNEVKRLASSSTDNSAKIAKDLEDLEQKIATSSRASLEATDSVRTIMNEITSISEGITELFDLLSESSAGSSQLQEALSTMRTSTVSMSEAYASILADVTALSQSMLTIRKESDEALGAFAMN